MILSTSVTIEESAIVTFPESDTPDPSVPLPDVHSWSANVMDPLPVTVPEAGFSKDFTRVKPNVFVGVTVLVSVGVGVIVGVPVQVQVGV